MSNYYSGPQDAHGETFFASSGAVGNIIDAAPAMRTIELLESHMHNEAYPPRLNADERTDPFNSISEFAARLHLAQNCTNNYSSTRTLPDTPSTQSAEESFNSSRFSSGSTMNPSEMLINESYDFFSGGAGLNTAFADTLYALPVSSFTDDQNTETNNIFSPCDIGESDLFQASSSATSDFVFSESSPQGHTQDAFTTMSSNHSNVTNKPDLVESKSFDQNSIAHEFQNDDWLNGQKWKPADLQEHSESNSLSCGSEDGDDDEETELDISSADSEDTAFEGSYYKERQSMVNEIKSPIMVLQESTKAYLQETANQKIPKKGAGISNEELAACSNALKREFVQKDRRKLGNKCLSTNKVRRLSKIDNKENHGLIAFKKTSLDESSEERRRTKPATNSFKCNKKQSKKTVNKNTLSHDISSFSESFSSLKDADQAPYRRHSTRNRKPVSYYSPLESDSDSSPFPSEKRRTRNSLNRFSSGRPIPTSNRRNSNEDDDEEDDVAVEEDEDDDDEPHGRLTKKKSPRSKTGCWTCRLRRKKCPEERPACSQCTRLGLQCDGYSNERPPFMFKKTEQHKRLGEIKEHTGKARKLRIASMHQMRKGKRHGQLHRLD